MLSLVNQAAVMTVVESSSSHLCLLLGCCGCRCWQQASPYTATAADAGAKAYVFVFVWSLVCRLDDNRHTIFRVKTCLCFYFAAAAAMKGNQ